MASSCKFKIAVPACHDEWKLEKLLARLRLSGYDDILIATFKVTQQAPDAKAEILEGFTNIANNLDCATDLIHINSTDADDKHDGAGAQAVRLTYLKSGEVYTADYDLEGATHVHLAALGTIDRFVCGEIIGSLDGLGAVVAPQGDIIIDVNATGTDYLKIPAGSIYSIGATMWCPAGWNMEIASLVSSIAFAPSATPPAYGDFANVYIDVNGTVTEGTIITHDNCCKQIINPAELLIPLAGEGYISIQHESTHTDVNVDVTHTITYVLYK